MSQFKYSKKAGENAVKAVGRSLPISSKQSVEICRTIRNKNLQKAKKILEDAINMKKAIPFKRYNMDIGHKKGRIAAGRFPVKACTHILKLLNTAEANAQFKGLPTSSLIIDHISAHKAGITWHYGRRRRKAKRTSIELILEEGTKKEKKAKGTKEVKKPVVEKGMKEKIEKKETPKVEVKKPEVKVEKKAEETTKVEKPETKKVAESVKTEVKEIKEDKGADQ